MSNSDKREETERQLRQGLERELRKGDGGGNGNEQTSSGETITDLKRRLRERDEKYSINYNSRGTSIFGRTIAD